MIDHTIFFLSGTGWSVILISLVTSNAPTFNVLLQEVRRTDHTAGSIITPAIIFKEIVRETLCCNLEKESENVL